MTLLEKCNADVYKAILDIKQENFYVGEHLIAILQKHEWPFDLTGSDMLWFGANLPSEIWDNKVHTFQFLFKSQQTTEMP